jgi:hypothetical protein
MRYWKDQLNIILVYIMVVNPGRSRRDPGGAERSGASPGREGSERNS